ncbi:hypothetical protein [Microterricola viridarii]|uniref:Uncharacterized protein n=1 Tax=Microterricola viridarii TaxID=412690 RepID=A0A1H1YFB7_9MICO|nr:hypothetical protein [Microterricola viridarii]SDT20071.1 hypothetical protein SAMN04489834_3066 [Microterricola viridarii]
MNDKNAGPRQWVEKVPGTSRRSRLTPVAGTDASPESPILHADTVFDAPGTGAAASGPSAAGPNDARLRADKPPHW